jgi:iodotyrosine deiodinase
VRQAIRERAEAEEQAFYSNRAPRAWLDALAPLGTDAEKSFLTTAPWVIAIFQERFGVLADGRKVKHYYAPESVGIATGLLISALHHAGLASLTHTPSPMGFLREILGRPRNERPFLLLVTGYPMAGATVPDIKRKAFEEFVTFM